MEDVSSLPVRIRWVLLNSLGCKSCDSRRKEGRIGVLRRFQQLSHIATR